MKGGDYKWIWSVGMITTRDESGKPTVLTGIHLDISNRKRIEQELTKSEERFSLAMKASKEGIWDWDLKSGENILQPQFNIHAWTDSSDIIKNVDQWRALIYPGDRQKAYQANYDCVNNLRDSFEVEYRMITRNGDLKWILGRGEVVSRGSARKALRMIGTHQDISKRKLAEEALNEAILKQNEAVKAGKVGLWDWDLETNEVHYSAEWKRQIGYAEHEIGNDYQEWEQRVHPDDLAKTLQLVHNSVKTANQDHTVEFRFRHKDGHYLWVLSHASVLCDETGKPVRMLRSHMDITEQKRTEKALRESEDFLNRTGDMAKVGGWEVDLNTNEDFWTKTTAQIHELPVEYTPKIDEAISYYHPDDQERVRQYVQRAIEFSEPYDYRVRLITARGRVRWVRAIGQPIFESGKCIRLSGTFQDITDRLKLEEQLRQSQKMEAIGTLAGGIAHDFNNILSSVYGYTELALDYVEKGSQVEGSLHEIYNSAKRARDLVKQILAYARHSDETNKPIRIDLITEEAIRLLRASLPSSVKIEQNIQKDLTILGNSTQFQQVFINICTNAAQAMEQDGGVLTINIGEVVLDKNHTVHNLDAG